MRRLSTLSLLFSSLLLACSPAGQGEDDDRCVGGKCDDPREGVDDQDLTAFPCDDIFENFSTRRNPDGSEITRFVDRLRDPLTALAYQGDSCPTTMAEIIDLMKQNESDCGANDGLATRVVSEEGQILDAEFAGYRGVTTKECGERESFDLMFSIFGLTADSPELPETGIEVIARDEQTGVFNYYKEVDGKMGFFGSGLDYLFDGHGDFLTDINGCGACHAGNSEKSGRGNLNMKELNNPWLHWEGTASTNGADELIKRFEDTMGVRKTGPNLEGIVKAGNRANNSAIIDALVAARDYKRLLGPLFCTEQLNINTGSRDKVPAKFMFTPRVAKGTAFNVKVSGAGYDNLLIALGSEVPGTGIADTRFAFGYVSRSFDDSDYVDQLVDKGIIDDQFAADVLTVDFTRSVFSDARCDLLEFSPSSGDIGADDLNAESLRDGFIENLDGAADGTPAAQLLAHFEASKDGESFDYDTITKNYIAACNDIDDNGDKIDIDADGTAKTVSQFQANAMKIRSRNIQLAVEFDNALNEADGSDARPRQVFEFPRTFAFDKIVVTNSADANNPLQVHPNAHFNPNDCTLTNEYVPVEKP